MGTLLVVEDDPSVQRVYRRLFSLKAYTFEIVSGGEEALVKAHSLHPSLILLDIVMKPMDGLEVLRRLRADEKTADISVIMLTNMGDDDYIKKAYALGAKGYMIKSNFNPSEILSEVDKYLK